MSVEVIEPLPCDLPPRGPGPSSRQRLDVSAVREWLDDHPGEWCRLMGANGRSFSLAEVNAIRGSLSYTWDEGRGARYISIQTRPQGEGKAVYARRETESEHEHRVGAYVHAEHARDTP